MKPLVPLVAVTLLSVSAAALAGDDCHRPMTEWRPREAVMSHVAGLGVTADHLRIDDGCYEVRGRDSDGNQLRLKLDPASLSILKLEVRFLDGADPLRYLPGARARARDVAQPPAVRPRRGPGVAPPSGTR